MEKKSLNNLEFEKILSIIASFAGSHYAKEKITLSRPTDEIKKIEELLLEIEQFDDLINSGMKISIGGIRDIREVIELIRGSSIVLGSEEFLKIAANIEVASSLKAALESHIGVLYQHKESKIIEIIKNIPKLSALLSRIKECIDDQGRLLDTASPALAAIRREHSQTVKETEKKLNLFIQKNISILQDNYFTLRNDRYVVPITASSQNAIQGIIHDQSASGQTVFIEPLEFLQANNRIAQLIISERNEIKKIFAALTSFAADSLDSLSEQFESLVYLDLIQAKTRFASKYNATKPLPVRDKNLSLKNARHPLLFPHCVGLDIEMNEKQNCIIITGPNGGGKSVALKTLGINALLMQTGNYVSADSGAQLPVFNQILVDIGENQSIEQQLSTFTAHLTRLKEILFLANQNSLVLIDEICVGTDPIEGGALACGVLKKLSKVGAFCVVTSHYDSLKKVAFTTEGFINGAMEFANNKPTFRFIMGMPGKSNALAIARQYGIPEDVLTDLVEVNTQNKNDESKLLEAIQNEYARAEALRKNYVYRINAIRLKEKELAEGLEQLEEFRKKKRDRVSEEFYSQFKKKIKEIEKTIAALKNPNKHTITEEEPVSVARKALKTAKESLKKLENLEPKLETNKNLISITPQQALPGKKVIWKQNLSQAILVKADFEKQRAEIDIEGKIFQLPLAEIALSKIKHAKPKQEISTSIYLTPKFIRNQIDLRGLRSEEAIQKVEDYLEEASQKDLDKVFLIHGKGTGALQKAITDYLNNSSYRKKYRPGRYGEGESGVTVVLFKPETEE